MHDKAKQNESLGKQVNDYLEKVGVQTPMTDKVHQSNNIKLNHVKMQVELTLKELGLDLTDDYLIDTQNRVEKIFNRRKNDRNCCVCNYKAQNS